MPKLLKSKPLNSIDVFNRLLSLTTWNGIPYLSKDIFEACGCSLGLFKSCVNTLIEVLGVSSYVDVVVWEQRRNTTLEDIETLLLKAINYESQRT